MTDGTELPYEHSSEQTAGNGETVDPDRRYRVAGIAAVVGIGLVGGILFMLQVVSRSDAAALSAVSSVATHESAVAGLPAHSNRSGITPARMVLGRVRPLDTIYTTDSVYLDVDLSRQHVEVRNRKGTVRSFPISSGNRFIRDGMATPPGVYTVQNMTPMAISRQFNNARLHHWIGVQGGVGFHGLDGNGYYGTLGVRPSSHGCIRMARESIREMYTMVHPGALIRVHAGTPARVVAFCAPTDTAGACLIDSANVFDRSLGKARLRSLYEGRAWTDPQPRLVHVASQRLRYGLEIGEASKIAKQQLPRDFSLAQAGRLLPVARLDRTRPSQLSATYLAASLEARKELAVKQADAGREAQLEPEYGGR